MTLMTSAVTLAVVLALASPSADDGPSDSEARKLYASGLDKFNEGDHDGAMNDFQASFDLEANPLSLYGLAQATNKAVGCRKAVKHYRRFSKMVDEGSQAYDVALQAIAECADKMAAEAEEEEEEELPPDPVPVPDDPPPDTTEDEGPPPDKPWHRDALGGTLVGVGLAGTVTGIALIAASYVDENNPCGTYGCFDEQLERIDRVRIAGAVVTGVGGALLIGGVVRWVVVARKQRRSASVVPAVGPRFTGVTVSGRF